VQLPSGRRRHTYILASFALVFRVAGAADANGTVYDARAAGVLMDDAAAASSASTVTPGYDGRDGLYADADADPRHRYSSLHYNAQIHPLTVGPLALRGVLWWQVGANTTRGLWTEVV
jgi:hypothetical protein